MPVTDNSTAGEMIRSNIDLPVVATFHVFYFGIPPIIEQKCLYNCFCLYPVKFCSRLGCIQKHNSDQNKNTSQVKEPEALSVKGKLSIEIPKAKRIRCVAIAPAFGGYNASVAQQYILQLSVHNSSNTYRWCRWSISSNCVRKVQGYGCIIMELKYRYTSWT